MGLLGTNGAGKTTLIKCALGLIRPQGGEARLLGEDSWTLSAAAKSPHRLRAAGDQSLSVDEGAAPDRLHGRLLSELEPRPGRPTRSREWSLPAEDRIGPLSVGQLQKVAIVLALGHEPELLILDEPAASLDPLARRQFLQMIIDLAEPGKRHGALLHAHHLRPGARGRPGGHLEVGPHRLARPAGRPEGADARQPGRQLLWRCTMRNPYAQVAMSYVHWARSWARIGYLIAGGLAAILAFAGALVAAAHGHIELLLFLDVEICCMLALHIRTQFSHPQARLIPDFRKVHGIVACGAAMVACVVLPTAFSLLVRLRPVGFVAIVTLLFGIALWLVMLRQTWVFPMVVAALFIGGVKPTIALIVSLTSAQCEAGILMIVSLAVVIIACAGFRLWHLTEDSPGYRFPNQTSGVLKTQDEERGDAEDSWLIVLLHRGASQRMIRHARLAATSRWSQVWRWQAEQAVWSPLFRSAPVIFMFAIFAWLGRGLDARSVSFMLIFLAFFLPSTFWPDQCARKGAAVAHELLLPVSRSAYVKQLGIGTMLNQFQAWCVLNAAAILWWFFAIRGEIPVAGAVSILAISALWQFWFFGVGTLLSLPQFQLNPMVGALWLASLVPLLIALAIARPFAEWQIEVITLSAILAFIGVLATKAAHRRWLVADID